MAFYLTKNPKGEPNQNNKKKDSVNNLGDCKGSQTYYHLVHTQTHNH